MRPRGFTLIELLVVIGIIAVLMSILLPTLAGARRTAQATVGVANLRSLSQVMFVYTNDNQGYFLTPFRSQWDGNSGNVWTDLVSPRNQGVVWSTYVLPDPNPFHTELFSYFWYSYMLLIDGRAPNSKEGFSPADGHASALLGALSSGQPTREGYLLWPSSFLYSPTFWTRGGRYFGQNRADMDPGTLQPQSVSSVTYPSGKVMLWERADFRKRSRGDGSPWPPAWNNPAASVHAATADGSVTEARTRDLLQQTTNNPELAPVGFGAAVDNPPLLAPYRSPGGTQDWSTGAGLISADAEFPLFFHSTRNGAQGRDLPR